MTPEDVIAAQLREAHTLARENGMELDALIIRAVHGLPARQAAVHADRAADRPVDLTHLSLYKPSDVPNLLNLTAEAG